MQNEFVTISTSEYNKLRDDQNFLNCLRGAGVDNWCGYDEADSIHREMKAKYALQTN
jgi:hypothetical protein